MRSVLLNFLLFGRDAKHDLCVHRTVRPANRVEMAIMMRSERRARQTSVGYSRNLVLPFVTGRYPRRGRTRNVLLFISLRGRLVSRVARALARLLDCKAAAAETIRRPGKLGTSVRRTPKTNTLIFGR